MPCRTGLDAAACFPNSHAETNSALRAYVSSLDGNIVARSATSENRPAKQTAAMRKKCIPNQATYTRFEIMFFPRHSLVNQILQYTKQPVPRHSGLANCFVN